MSVLKLNEKEIHLTYFEMLEDKINEKITTFFKAFSFARNISVIEGVLIALAVYRVVWLEVFDVTTPQLFDYLYSRQLWIVNFFVLILLNVVSLAVCSSWNPAAWIRVFVFYGYACSWFVLGLLAAAAHYESPAFGNFMAFSFLSAYLAVKLTVAQFRTNRCSVSDE